MIAALLALLVSLFAHPSPAPAAAPVVSPTPAVVVDDPTSWGERAVDPPADPGEWRPASDSPLCAEEPGVVVDCWIP